jgi:hypothetical protein
MYTDKAIFMEIPLILNLHTLSLMGLKSIVKGIYTFAYDKARAESV